MWMFKPNLDLGKCVFIVNKTMQTTGYMRKKAIERVQRRYYRKINKYIYREVYWSVKYDHDMLVLRERNLKFA